MARTKRTTQPYSFDDLDHRQFEDLARQLARRMEVDWIRLEPVGRLGADRGRDIRGIERVAPSPDDRDRREREWRFQVKRHREVGPAGLRSIVRDAVPDPSDIPHAVIAVVAADVSSDGFDAFHDEAEKQRVVEHQVWSRAILNDMLLEPANADLRAFYFGDGHAIDGTVHIPLGLDASPGRDAELTGREREAESVRNREGDLIIVGVPGTGKTRLVLEARDVRFLNHEAGTDEVRRAMGLALVLMARGVEAESLAGTAMFGSWMGEESDRYERLRLAFAAKEPNGNKDSRAVQAAGVRIYESMRDRALEEERQERIEGKL